MKQIGLTPEYDETERPDYQSTEHRRLNRQVWLYIADHGVEGATTAEIARAFGKTCKSIAGRCTELMATGHIRRTEARRGGAVYVSCKAEEKVARCAS